VIDDDTAVLRFMTKMLASMGYAPVHQASTPAQALQLWEHLSGEINLVISDFVMPELTGDRLALRLMNTKPGVKVLFVSGNDVEALDSVIPLRLGQNFLQKPFSMADVRKAVEYLCAAH